MHAYVSTHLCTYSKLLLVVHLICMHILLELITLIIANHSQIALDMYVDAPTTTTQTSANTQLQEQYQQLLATSASLQQELQSVGNSRITYNNCSSIRIR
jgi:hypothetical protein